MALLAASLFVIKTKLIKINKKVFNLYLIFIIRLIKDAFKLKYKFI